MCACRGMKDCESFKTRSVLCILVLGLFAISGAFIYTAFTVTNPNTTTHSVPTVLSNMLTKLQHAKWCLDSSSLIEFPRQFYSQRSLQDNSSLSQVKHRACLQLVIIIPGDYYPTLRNQSMYRGSIDRKILLKQGKDEMLDLMFYLQHNLSTSTRYSRDVLVPSFISVSAPAHSSLPDYILDASSCEISHHASDAASPVSICSRNIPHFHVDKRWNVDLDVYVAMTDRNELSIHLMYTSYFLLIMAMSAMIYSLCRSRGSSRSKTKVVKMTVPPAV